MSFHFVNPPATPGSTKRVILEYVFTNQTNFQFMSKMKVVNFEPSSAEECPLNDTYNWNDANRKEFTVMIMKPVAMFENPFLSSPHKLVLCDLWLTMDKPADINTRVKLTETLNRLQYDPTTGHKPKEPHDPWFGFEQEYFVVNDDGVPVSYDPIKFDYTTAFPLQAVGHEHDKNIGVERDLSVKHLQACIYAGVKVHGAVRENGPSQWEYQIGPCDGFMAGDHLQMSRYILLRLAEQCGLRVTLKTAPSKGGADYSAGHLNFSVRKMREKEGIRFIHHAINILSKSDQKPLLKIYDQTIEEANTDRLSNKKVKGHPVIDEFVFDGANKAITTVRIPPLVAWERRGYLEDRRPPSSVDPYAAAAGMIRACIFGDFLKPGNESLKDLSVWDKDASELIEFPYPS
ncbi:glutamine synthetase-like [Saccostrea echinata]|uniref:glutamine synthetase-like n=1 Tax=Saccostrea echinata TaxID=191078 RepID=UPI002A82A3E9|nr:glutamine synthetase-like [Saccostrea echinata]XP_061176282.1 glutamine synthetase-like [Saccostrea echinata]